MQQKCPATGKVKYRDRVAALLALSSTARKDNRRDKDAVRVYLCPRCRGWHLTSRRHWSD